MTVGPVPFAMTNEPVPFDMPAGGSYSTVGLLTLIVKCST